MVAKIVSNVSLEYLLLFKSSGYCCDGNLSKLTCKLHILYYCNVFGNLFYFFCLGGGIEGEGKMALPIPYIINCDMILSSYI